jgi:eukaryotic-like serine/threonine-protein kinase
VNVRASRKIPLFSMTFAAGTRLGPYEILSLLGAGGMGEVYRARDTRLGREAAVKVLPQEFSASRERVARFEQEARSASALNHPNIVTIYDVGWADGAAYVGMELVSGSSLRDVLAEGVVPPRRLLAIGAQIAQGLAAAHEAGIVHRDVKPENVMVTRDGRVKILDFGLAKVAPARAEEGSQIPTAAQATEPGAVLGTVGYMSPEQIRGLPLDHRTDIFSLGAVLYEMASGARPFRAATTADTMTAILREEPADFPAGAPPALERVVRRCLEKSPEARFQSARDLAFALETSSASASLPAVASAPEAHRRRRGVWVAAVALAAIFGAVLVLRPFVSRERPPFFSRVVRLTSGPQQEFGAAISPDGKWVAYLSNARGPVDVWVKFVAGGEAVNLTEKLDLDIQRQDIIGGLGISADGSSIAFDAGPRRGAPSDFKAWVIPAPLGGQARILVREGRSVRWSPDGRRIAYVRPGAFRGDALCVADADGSNAKEVLKPRGGVHAHWPAWSRDGRFLYFIYGIGYANEEPSEIARVPAEGGEPELVVRTSRRAVFPAPLSGGLVYSANPDSADLALWWRPLSGGRPVRLTTGVGDYAGPMASADERSIIVTYDDPLRQLASIAVRFGAPVSTVSLTSGFLGDQDPSVSPQGDRLVWSSARSGNPNLWIANVDASNPRPLTSGTGFDERPAFSPDGKQVAFVSERSGQRGIWLVSAEGGAPRLLAPARVLDTLTWSADGSEILFAAPAGDLPGLYRLAVASGRVAPFATPSGGHAPAWRPGQQEIAYLEITPGPATMLRFVDPSGRRLHMQLLEAKGWGQAEGRTLGGGALAWSADGKKLVVAGNSGIREPAIFVVEPDGSEPFQKLVTPGISSRIRGISWSPDGGSLVIGQYERRSDVVLLTRDR